MAAAFYELAIQQLSRLSLASRGVRGIATQSSALQFKATGVFRAMPTRKKKKLDLGLANQRDAKKKRRLEKHIRRIIVKGRKLKPIDEIEGTQDILNTLTERRRAPPIFEHAESERRALLHKAWTRHRCTTHMHDLRVLEAAEGAQLRALAELRAESETLYQAAVQMDPEFVPCTVAGPVYTPPIKDYETPDGEYVDKTKSYYVPLPEGFKLKLR